MRARTNNQRYLLWLALGTAAMALAVASLLVFELAQKRAIKQANAMRSDSLTALAFQFEREFIRLRQSLSETLASKAAPDADALSLRYDIFLSRLTLLRESPSVSLLTEREEYRKVIPRLEPLVVEMDQVLAGEPIARERLPEILSELNDLGIEVQALTQAANSEVARMLERQTHTMSQQNELIIWLTVAQLVLLVVASGALVVRQRRMEAERLALETMTEDLREAHLRAETASRSKSQFLANMSHELRTPFNGLMGMLGLLEGTSPNAQQLDYIQTAQASASHLLTLLNDILDLSALETGKLTLKPTVVQVPRLISEVSALMLSLAKEKGLEFKTHLPTVPLPSVLADETRLKQILFNLVNNAIKFTDAGSVRLTVSEGSRSAQSVEIVFNVQDTGIGMDTQVLSRLFQRFYQVEDSSTRRFGGTGLGLEISQSLARMMHGEISVTSVLNVGSTFTVTLHLPIQEATAEPVAQAAAVAPEAAMDLAVGSPVQAQGPQSEHAQVLVVEDHAINQKLVGVLLGRMACQVRFCENGQLAVEEVRKSKFDLILMDVNMPVMDGLQATREIRALPGPASQTPIVVVTADVMNEAREKSFAAGANDFISKPLQLERLREVVRRYAVGKTIV
jgi:signal transduction histidine kinase/ActR/RegA family two-component response regulator